MALFGLFKKGGQRRAGNLKSAKKVDFKPTVIYKPARPSRARQKLPARNPGFNWKIPLAALGAVVLLSLIVYGIVLLVRSQDLSIKKFKLLGNRTINDAQIGESLQNFSGQNIFTVNSSNVEKKLLSDFSIFNGVEVMKFFPDTLFIKISEREPKLVYVNLSGAFLVDSKGQVLQQIFNDPVVIPDEKLNIARGLGDPTSAFLQEQYLNEFKTQKGLLDKTPDEQQAVIAREFDFNAIPLTDRIKKLSDLQKQYLTEFNTYWEKEDQAVDVSAYSSYPRVQAMEANLWKQNDTIALSRLQLTTDLSKLFETRHIPLTKIIWEGELLVKVVTADNKYLIFGTDRQVTEQFEDYLLVINELTREGRPYCQIDFSASKIAVRQCK